MKPTIAMEICVDSVESAQAAQEGGADRVECCANLPQGGITPSAGLIEEVRSQISLPVHVLIRPRVGDFLYSPAELLVMEQDIAIAKQLGAEAVVLGALTPNRSVDLAAMRSFVEMARPMKVTFHRAFDLVTDPLGVLEDLIELGCDFVLTSGQAVTAVKGHHVIRDIVDKTAGRIAVIAGAGVSSLNVRWLVEETGLQHVHIGSAVSRPIPATEGLFAAERSLVNADAVREIRAAIEARRM